MRVTFDGLVALITGGTRGIGEATARAFLDSGAKGVVVTGRTPENLKLVKERLDAGPRLLAIPARADDPEAAHDTIATTISELGSLDILVNNAGTNPAAGDLADVDIGAVSKTWAVNQMGPLLWSREAWRQWMRDHGGSIVNVSSAGGLRPAPLAGAYYVSKAALIHMTQQLAMEMAPDVRVNAVAPAVVRTRLSRALWEGIEDEVAAAYPLKRIGEPEDVASAILFLAGARGITGVTMPVDGGAVLAEGIQGLSGRKATD